MTLRSLGLAVFALLLGLGGGLAAGRVCGSPTDIIIQFSPTPVGSSDLRVYVTGAVVHPGVYPIHAGDRLVDAVEAAGGPAPDADTEAVNFSLRIQDQEQIHVPRVGEIGASGTAEAVAVAAVPSAAPQLVDINHADVNLLRTLPGVGQTRAANIVTSRQSAGPFKQPADLVQRKLLTQKIFDQDKNLIEALP